jgi:WXG100 family type VII secretion target
MANPISVTDPGMQVAAQALQDAEQTVNAVQSSVSGAQAELRWSGDASTRYKNEMAAWLDGLTRVKSGLQTMHEAMQAAQQGTNTVEDHNAETSMWYR